MNKRHSCTYKTKPSSSETCSYTEQYQLQTSRKKTYFVGHFCNSCFVSVMLPCLFIAAIGSPARKGLTSCLSCICDIFFVFLSLSHDFCPLPYLRNKNEADPVKHV